MQVSFFKELALKKILLVKPWSLSYLSFILLIWFF